MNTQMTRGGRAIIDTFDKHLDAIRQSIDAARAAGEYAAEAVKRNPDLSRQLINERQLVALMRVLEQVGDMKRLLTDELDPLLRRRAGPDNLSERVAALEKQVADLKRQWATEGPRIVRNDRAERG